VYFRVSLVVAFFSSWRAYTFRDGDVKRRRTHEYPSRRGARNDERERERALKETIAMWGREYAVHNFFNKVKF
jgi:hypothetical protein